MRRNILLAATTLLAFFGLLEVGLRLSGRVPTDQLRSPDLETLDTIPGLYDPGQDFIDRVRPDLPYRVRINALGFRGAETQEKKAAGTFRVVVIGDSYTFGPYVEDDRTYPAALGRSLGEAAPNGVRVEVINAGANGFTIEDELAFLEDKASKLEPDLIVLAFCQNDVLDLGRTRPMSEVRRDHARLKSTFAIGPALRLLQHTAIFNGMQRAAATIKVRKMRAAAPAGEATPEQWARYRRMLGEFVEVARSSGARLLMVVWMSADQMSGRNSLMPQEKLAGFARELGLEMLDLAPALRELEEEGLNPYFVPLDGHPNALAYEAAARATAQRLAELGYLAPEPPRP